MPGGKVDLGESPVDALIREAREEGFELIGVNPDPVMSRTVDGKPVQWFSCRSARMLDDYKEKGRIAPILATRDQILTSGYGNEYLNITMIEKKKAFWFSRHHPTVEQVEDIESMGYVLTHIEKGMDLGNEDIANDLEAESLTRNLRWLVADYQCKAVFGVFPTPILCFLYLGALDRVERGAFYGDEVPCYAAWNAKRTVEGGAPTFVHKCFKQIGDL